MHLFLGNTPQESEELFEAYLFNFLCQRSGVNPEVHGVFMRMRAGVVEYSMNCLHKLRQDAYDDLFTVLSENFAQHQPPAGNRLACWSVAAEQAGYTCGTFYETRGGHSGRGELHIRPLSLQCGICTCLRYLYRLHKNKSVSCFNLTTNSAM